MLPNSWFALMILPFLTFFFCLAETAAAPENSHCLALCDDRPAASLMTDKRAHHPIQPIPQGRFRRVAGTVEGLHPATDYDVYVWAVYPDKNGLWAGPVRVRTKTIGWFLGGSSSSYL